MKGALRKLLLSALLLPVLSRADPQSMQGTQNASVIKVGDTTYLKDADQFIVEKAVIVKSSPKPKFSPSATPTATATPQPTPPRTTTSTKPHFDPADLEEAPPERDYQTAIIHRSNLNVGRQIPVPTTYGAPQIVSDQNGGVTVVPSTPTSFGVVQTGTTATTDASGNTTVLDTQLSGFVNYGSPIQTIVPVRNQHGQPIGNQVITVSPNPIRVPVTTTIQLNQ